MQNDIVKRAGPPSVQPRTAPTDEVRDAPAVPPPSAASEEAALGIQLEENTYPNSQPEVMLKDVVTAALPQPDDSVQPVPDAVTKSANEDEAKLAQKSKDKTVSQATPKPIKPPSNRPTKTIAVAIAACLCLVGVAVFAGMQQTQPVTSTQSNNTPAAKPVTKTEAKANPTTQSTLNKETSTAVDGMLTDADSFGNDTATIEPELSDQSLGL
jgi:hypothetical protein